MELLCPAPTTGRKPLASKGGKRARTVRAAPPPERRQGHGTHQEHKASHEQGRAPAGAREGAGARAGGARPPRRGRPRGLPVRALGVVAAEPLQVLRLQPRQHHPDSDADAHGHPRGQLQELEARLQPLRQEGRARHRDPRAHAGQRQGRGRRRGAPPPRGLPRGPRLRRQPDRRRAPSSSPSAPYPSSPTTHSPGRLFPVPCSTAWSAPSPDSGNACATAGRNSAPDRSPTTRCSRASTRTPPFSPR